MKVIEVRAALGQFASTGDEQAFAQLVRGHIDLVYAAARRQVIDQAAADDVTQAVFILLARKARNLGDGALLGGWLVRTARYCAADANRQHLCRQRHEREAAAMKSQLTPTDADARDILPMVDAALADLGEKDRAAITMRYLQQQAMCEIAEALGTTEEAARKRIMRAMDRLRGRLAPLRRAITVTALATALEQSASITAPPALAGAISTVAVSSSAATTTGAIVSLLVWWKVGLAVVVAALLATGITVALQSPTANSTSAATGSSGNAQVVLEKLPPMPSVASLSPPQRRIYELVFTLRNSLPMARPEEWVPALREITQIGSPAVPALCIELDRTNGDLQQQIFLMALHRIGDPRAVPSLIRAIARVNAKPGDFGTYIYDPNLLQFMEYWETPERREPSIFTFPRGINECIAALESITKHSEGHGPIESTPKQGRAAFARQWQKWWTENQDEVLIGADATTVDAARYDGDLVGAVGVEIMKAFFPTGPEVHLGPVRELDLHVQGMWDSPAYMSLATGKPLCLDEGCEDGDVEHYKTWFPDHHIDVMASVYGDGSWHAQLDGNPVRTWPVANTRFDSIDSEVREGGPLNFGSNSPNAGFDPRDPRTGKRIDDQYPATFLFQTRENLCGILQIVNVVDGQTAVHIRYRLWPEQNGHGQASSQSVRSPETLPSTGAKFGDVREITLATPSSGKPAALNLRTGETQVQEIDINNSKMNEAAREAWAGKLGIDVYTIIYGGKLIGLGSAVTVAQVSDAAWENLSAETCAAIAKRASLRKREDKIIDNSMVVSKEKIPGNTSSTWIVITADGPGILQITDIQSATLRLRYKLVGSPKPHP